MPSPEESDQDDLRHYIRQDLRAGYVPLSDIALAAVETVDDEADVAELLPAAQRILEEELMLLREEQRAWPAVTDCDRLDAAFAELEARGIVARQNFTCCGNCGVAEMFAEFEKFTSVGRDIRGYVFFHQQDTESAVEFGRFCLNYGSTAVTQDDEAAALRVANDVVECLKRHGVGIQWDGRWATRIGVKLNWQRRR